MKKIQIIGNVTRDAEVQTIAPERSAINFTVAVNERYKDKNGQKIDKATFVKCVLWCKNPSMSQYIKKGLKVYISGSPEADGYIGEGNKVITSLKIIVRDIEFLGSPNAYNPAPASNRNNKSNTSKSNAPVSSDEDFLHPTPDDDLPF